jgi:hypothetical protein
MENILSELAISTIKVNDYLSSYKIVDVMEVFVFEQVWGSTALGFGGWGGSTMTSAWTHVVRTYEGKFIVFFNGRHAYTVDSANEKFMDDLMKQDMKSVDEALKLYS